MGYFITTETITAGKAYRRPPGRRRKSPYPRFSGGSSGRRFYSPGVGKWLSRDPIGEGKELNIYDFVGNGPTCSWDALGLFDSARFFASVPGTMWDFWFQYKFRGDVDEELVQIASARVDFVCTDFMNEEWLICTVETEYPERFRLDSTGIFFADSHRYSANYQLNKYCSCICDPCCKSIGFTVTIQMKLWYGVVGAPGPESFSYLNDATIQTDGTTVVPNQRCVDCTGTVSDTTSEIPIDWYSGLTPSGSAIVGTAASVVSVTHQYIGTVDKVLCQAKASQSQRCPSLGRL